MKYIDITPVITEKMAVFPGDVSFKRNISLDYKKGDHLQLSSIETTLHLGAHADSSGHYHADGSGVEQRPLDSYFGKAQVIEVKIPRGERILLKDIAGIEIKASRVLFKTGSFPNPNHWNSDFNSLSPEVIEFLHSKNVVLVGIDTPSVDPETSKGLESHQALYKTKIAVLEGIVLADATAGLYSLVALPLPIKDADASPVRALLFKDSEIFENK